MFEQAKTWALLLAAGEGTRLQSLTTPANGVSIPKQFCSLWDGSSLLSEALSRAEAVTADAQICAVVAGQHRRWWEPLLRTLPTDNVVVQPANRGTGNGILLPLLYIAERDPHARIVILPSDHHVRDEGVLTRALRHGVEQMRWRFTDTLLLGVVPEEPDAELGYIVPGPADGRGALEVVQFVEKPSPMRARELIRCGGLWNAFIIISTAPALLSLFRRRTPEILREMRAARGADAIGALYEKLPVKDFSRDILEGQEISLRVLPVPHCGWSDLGTPRRVAEVLRRSCRPSDFSAPRARPVFAHLSLAAQHELQHPAG